MREALERLQQSGLVQISQGGATRVQDWRTNGGLDLLFDRWRPGRATPEQWQAIRRRAADAPGYRQEHRDAQPVRVAFHRVTAPSGAT